VATDNAGNVQLAPTTAQASTPVDTSVPTTTAFSFPTAGGTYNAGHWTGTIGGSATDNLSGVQQVQVSILNNATNKYWDGTSFASSSEVFQKATLASPGTTSTTWSLSFPSTSFLADGSYTIHGVATDVAGNTEATGLTATFNYDTTPPSTTALSFPAAGGSYNASGWTGTITGSASDSFSGVQQEQVSILNNTTHKYWTGSSFAGNTEVFQTATLAGPGSTSTTWSLSFPNGSFPTNGSYSVHALATDEAGNAEASGLSATFTYDTAPPNTPLLSFPAAGNAYNASGWTGTIGGSATDSFSGIQQEQVSILDNATHEYWNGSSFASSTEVFLAATLASPGAPSTTWSLSFPNSSFPNDGSYSVHSLATDAAGNVEATGQSTTFNRDTTPPNTAALSFPAAGGSYNASGWTGTIGGPVSDAVSGVQQEQVSILDNATQKYWNGTSFASSTEVFLPATLASPGSTSTTWSVPFSNTSFPADGSYRIHALATDEVGHAETTGQSTTFNYDTAAPSTTALSFPAAGSSYNASGWAGTIGGSASASVSGVQQEQVSILDNNIHKYWDGTSFASGTEVFLTATLASPGAASTTWSLSFPSTSFPADGSYAVQGVATDAAGNMEVSGLAATFNYDATPPNTTALSFPVAGGSYNASAWTGTITGSASDNFTGVQQEQVSILDNNTHKYWTGSSFASSTEVFRLATLASPGSTSTSWNLSFPSSSFPADGSYRVHALATDEAGNVETLGLSATFNYDITAPTTAALSFPAAGGSYNASGWTGTLAGSASDNVSGVQREQVSILDNNTTKYWNGSSFASGTEVFLTATLASPGATSTTWSLPFPNSSFPADGSYSVHALATDAAGNAEATGTLTTFSYDTSPPNTTALSFPAAGASYNAAGWTGTITGSATDSLSGVQREQVSILNNATHKYWNGSTFGSSSEVFQTATLASPGATATTWSLSFPNSSFPADGSYSVHALATDKAGNTEASGLSATFNYDTAAPSTPALSFPAAGGSYNVSGWTGTISGSANDSTSGVQQEQVSILDKTTNMYWNGTSFASATEVFRLAALASPGSTSTTWSLSFLSSTFAGDGLYSVHALATDAAGNTEAAGITTTFSYDTTAPSTTVLSFPATGSNYNASGWTGTIAGSATDSFSGVQQEQVSILDNATNKYWNGSSFFSSTEVLLTATLASPGATSTTWSLPFPSNSFPADGSYSVHALATDKAGNTEAGGLSATFNYDSTPPNTPALSFPAPGAIYNASGWTGTIAGSASDSLTGVQQEQVSILDNATHKYWDGTGFASTTEVFRMATLVSPGANLTTWSLSFPSNSFLGDGLYSVHALATDKAGNTEASGQSATFTYDTTAPNSTVSTSGAYNASGWTGSIAGTAGDNGGGDSVTSVAVSIFDGSHYWTGSAFSATSETFVTATGTTSWSYGLASSALTSGTTYTVHSLATDQAGNVQTSFGSNTFSYDTSPPTSTVSTSGVFNASGWTGSIAGTAGDNGGGDSVTSVAVSIFDGSHYWTGSAFSATNETFVTATGTTSWSYTLASSSLTSGTTYTVHSKAADQAGNVQTSFGSNTFSYDTALPTSTVSTSGVFNVGGWTGSIAGTAGDNGGGDSVTSVAVSIFDGSHYWTGSTFSATSETFVTATGTTSWSYALASSALTSDMTYTVHSKAADQAGNVQTSFSSNTFSYDTTPPNPTVLSFPAAGGSYNASGWAGTISGSADNSFSGVKQEQVSILDNNTHMYWNGSNFVSSTEVFQTATLGSPGPTSTPWSLSFPNSWFPADGSYSVHALATDKAGNTEVTGLSATFNYDTTAPTLTISQPNKILTANQLGGYQGTYDGATASDNLSTTLSYSPNNPVFPLGTTTVQVTATDAAGNQTKGSYTVTVNPGSAFQLTLASPTQVSAGGKFTVTVNAEDSVGNIAPSATGSVVLSLEKAPAKGKLSGLTSEPVQNGVATFSNLSLNVVGSGYQLLVTSTSGLIAAASSLSVLAPATHLGITPPSSPISVGSQVIIIVKGLTASNMTDILFTDLLKLKTSDPHATVVAQPITNGVQQFTVTFMTAGPQTITVTDLTRSKFPRASIRVRVSA